VYQTSNKFWEKPKSNLVVYGLIDPRNGLLKYIGQTIRGLTRIRDHIYDLNDYNSKYNTRKINWLKSLKRKNLVFEVIYLEYCNSIDELNEAEEFYISYFKSVGSNLLNHDSGGKNCKRKKMTEETRKLISERTKLGMSDPKVKERLRISHLGKIPSNKGQKHSFQAIQKIKEKNKLRSIKVIDSNGIIYESLLDASKKLNCTPTDIRRCLLNPKRLFKNLSFKKIE
jgi:group I intron endonuclease